MNCHHGHSPLETCPECGFDAFVRNNYFTGKMMGAGEFTTETLYHADKMRHHNLRLHGTGTVCGLRVQQHPSPDCQRRYVVVEPGSALDCCGHEILVAHQEIVDVAGHPEVMRRTADNLLHTLQLCVRYRECPTEDVPVLYDECGCDDTQCAPNRILESFAFDVLVDAALSNLAATDLAVQGALVATNVHSVTGFLRANAAGRLALVDPADAHRLVIIDTVRRSRRTLALAQEVRALALSTDGMHVFAVTTSSDAAPESEVHVYLAEDGSEVGSTLRKLPGTTGASVMRAAATSDATRALLVYVRDNGQIHAFARDAANGIVDAPAAPVASAANLDGFVAAPDGSMGYALDTAAAHVKLIDFSGTAPADLAGLPAGAQPKALVAYAFQAGPQLAMASQSDRRVYIVDRTSNAVTTVDLQHPPEALAAVGDGSAAAVWLHVLEHDGNAWYVQAIALSPMATAGAAPLATAARSVGSGAQQVVLVGADGTDALLDVAMLAEGQCGDHVWHQLDACPHCDSGDCVVLATVAPYRTGAALLDLPAAADDLVQRRARIDNRAGRRMLASTASLQAWLECLQTQGGIAGPPGPPGQNGQNGQDGQNGQNGLDGQNGQNGRDGVGLNVDLPKIIDIGWEHHSTVPLQSLLQRLSSLHSDQTPVPPDEVIAAVTAGGLSRIPVFTIYFNRVMRGIDRQTLHVRVDMPTFVQPNPQASLVFIGTWSAHEIYGDLIPVQASLNTPHTNESSPFAAVFVPRREYVLGGIQQLELSLFLAQRFGLEFPTITVSLKGEFVFAPDAGGHYTQDGVLDGENIGGRIGRNEARPPPIAGGKNPSGDLAQGGRFESWFFVKPTGDVEHDAALPPAAIAGAPGGMAAAGFINPNFASVDTLRGVRGVSPALARRIVDSRGETPFTGVADLRQRARISDREWQALSEHLLLI